MSSKRYAEEFKIEAVKQITERHYPVAGVSARLGVSQHSLYVPDDGSASQRLLCLAHNAGL